MAYKFNPFTGKLDDYGPVLTGTGTVSAAADGTAALPGIAFTNDLNTGIYSPGADQLAISTGGAPRVTVTSTGVGIGDTGPDSTLTIKAAASTTPLRVSGPSSEFLRCDQQGRLLVGTSTSASAGGNAQYARIQVFGNTYNDSYGILNLGRKEASTSITSGEYLGAISFSDQSGNEYANIIAIADAAAGNNDYPGRLVFATTADGASSPTERMGIKSNGTINFSNVSVYADNTAALAGGLVAGDVYRKSDGTLMITY